MISKEGKIRIVSNAENSFAESLEFRSKGGRKQSHFRMGLLPRSLIPSQDLTALRSAVSIVNEAPGR